MIPQPGVLPKKPKLSVCMIVRDEEKMLPRCLKSVQGVADELIVVDTGSKDNTISIAKDFGAKIFHFKWHDDFAAARNESLKHATGDWILQIDADEELLSDSILHLKDRMLRSTMLKYVVICDNGPIYPERRFAWVDRLFRRHPKLWYHRPYHEEIGSSVEKLIMAEPRWQVQYEPNIRIRHYGYEEQSTLHRKLERGIRMMKSYLKENPNDDYILVKLGGAYYLLGNYEEAEAYFRKVLEINPDLLEINFDLGMTLQKQGKLEAAIKYYKKSIAFYPDLSEVYVNLGAIYIQKGMLDQAISELKRALAINPYIALGHNYLGMAYKNKGMLDESIAELNWAIAINPDLAEAHHNLAIAYYLEKMYKLAIKHCDKAIELGLKVEPEFLRKLKAFR